MKHNQQKTVLLLAGIMCLLMLSPDVLFAQTGPENEKKPNVVLFLADDMTYTDAGIYGNDDVRTPNIDQLAEGGMKFTHCFTASAMCSPARQQLLTGMYPVRNGAHPNHSVVKEGTRSIFHHFREMGYRVALVGKQHIGPPSSYPYTYLGGRNHDGGKGNPMPLKNARTFIKHNDKHTYVKVDSSHPWLLVVASLQPHEPWNRGYTDLYDPQKLTVPPYLVDLPATRKRLSQYYGEVTYMDHQVGHVRQILDDLNELDETLFLFFSEHGASFPYGKYTLYDTGVRAMLVARWPGVIEPGTTTDALVDYSDVVPTLIDAAGGNPDDFSTGIGGGPDGGKGFDGSSFLPVLKGETNRHQKYVYGVHTNYPSGRQTPYPIRSIRSKRYKLIWNLNHEVRFGKIPNRKLFRKWKKATEDNEFAKQRVNQLTNRPEFEFYDLKEDPYEMNNLASESKHGERISRMKNKLKEWMKQQGDRGMKTEKNSIKHLMQWRQNQFTKEPDEYKLPEGY